MARPDLDLIWGDNSAPFTPISDSDYQDGWAFRAGLPPKKINFDYYQNLADQRAAWLGDQALLSVGHEWQNDISYDANAYVRPVGGGALYKSLSGSNIGNEPTVSPASWELITLENFVAASTTVAGKVELATNTEAQTGTDAVRAVTPAALASVTGTTTRAGLLELATNAETITGTSTSLVPSLAALTALFNDTSRRTVSATAGMFALPGGQLVKYGRTGNLGDTPTGAIQTTTLAFSTTIAFGSAPSIVMAFPISLSGGPGADANVVTYWDQAATTSTTVAFKYQEMTTSTQANWAIGYIAIGV